MIKHRVKDDNNRNEYTISRSPWNGETVLDKPATDRFGQDLPAKPYRPLSSLHTDSGKPLAKATKAELIEQAATHQIDLGGASTKGEIVAEITAHEQGTPAS